MTKFKNDFNLYARDRGISTMKLEGFTNYQTPYILEERSLNVTQMDVFSRLMFERIIWVAGVIDEDMSPIIQAQLMYLDSLGDSDITLHVDSPGGSVKAGLSIIDVMDYIKSDVRTVNTGMAASMGAVILGAGKKGKRNSLRFSKTMIHQSSGGATGNISDAEITMTEWIKTNNLLFELIGGYCNKPAEVVKNDANRDLWLDAQETLGYGLIDEIITSKK